jgi:hypothetical protein
VAGSALRALEGLLAFWRDPTGSLVHVARRYGDVSRFGGPRRVWVRGCLWRGSNSWRVKPMPKATQLEAALALVPAELLGEAVVVPLLNGIDHVGLLRARLGAERILPGAIYVESERVEVGRVREKTPFVEFELAPHPRAAAVCAEVEAAGLACRIGSTESAALWRNSPRSRRSR